MIDRPVAYNSVILIQAGLSDPASQALRRTVLELIAEDRGRVFAFFHAAAAALDDERERRAWASLADQSNVLLRFCQTARARRVGGAPGEPFEASSLVRFWDAVLQAENLLAPARCAVRPGGFVLRVKRRMTEPEARESLELVLAGASLELDMVVLFEGDGLSVLAGDRSQSWSQLVDHDLARMVTTSTDYSLAPLELVDATTVEHWRSARSWIEL